MMVKVSTKLGENDLEVLKYLFEAEGIALQDLEQATTGFKVFQLLEQRGKCLGLQPPSSVSCS